MLVVGSAYGIMNNLPRIGAGDYTYDHNGNMVVDPHKNITTTYNHLNLPEKIEEKDSNKFMEITYDALGTKLKQVVKDGTTILSEKDCLYEND
ncbi:MAG: hypothetical protein HKO66_02390 [Saprospiraceae bacterium]|uniref:hypothetical protein n=1 Tax=Winogradskyella sp. TaxID=1883156 RepID=UPI00185DCD5E|nr:hypothetical protein [Winogradskyella sp.]NNL91061.1 hypothetical protein [Saprospiraceae bacterium]